MARYKVILDIEATEEDIKNIHGKGYQGDIEQFVCEEIGWSAQSFTNQEIVSIEEVDSEKDTQR